MREEEEGEEEGAVGGDTTMLADTNSLKVSSSFFN